ncbi:MAG: tRNA dihydrouridine synthase DusB [Erysipelotrichaceae bacterium]
MKFKIGEVEIPNRIIVGPMAGVSNIAFREIAHEFGAGLICTEMISDKGIQYHNQKTKEMTKISNNEGLISMQIFGHDVDSMVNIAQYLDQETTCNIIDINMGCPVAKVVNSGSGSALMKNPELAYDIVSAVVSAVSKPVSVKMRLGWDNNSINVVEFAQLMEKAGASALTIHARTRAKMYSGVADWSLIKTVKEIVKIPVIGNGDVVSVEKAQQLLEETGCDAVMIARGVLGKPWLISECLSVIDDPSYQKEITLKDKFEIIDRHTKRLISIKGEKIAIKEMRSQVAWYLHGLAGNNKVKEMVNKTESYSELNEILSEYQEWLEKLAD